MIKKALFGGIKILKISTWISAIAGILLLAIVAFFVAFPTFLKAPIENRLSVLSPLQIKFSEVSFALEQQGLSFKIHQLRASTADNLKPVLKIDTLKWHLNLSNLIKDLYQPAAIYIDTLRIYPQFAQHKNLFKIDNIKKTLAGQNLSALAFLQSLHINKTLIKNGRIVQIAPITISRTPTDLRAKITNQNLNLNDDGSGIKADISAVITHKQLQNDAVLTVPLLINNRDFKLHAKLKLFSENNQDWLQINAKSEEINAQSVHHYLPQQNLLELQTWLKNALKSGKFSAINFAGKYNLSKQTLAKITLNADLSQAELLFHPDWQPLRKLDATMQIDNEKLHIKVNHALLQDLPLKNIMVRINDIYEPKLSLKIDGEINAKSEQLLPFLKRAPLQNQFEILDKITLTGAIFGNVKLQLSLADAKIQLAAKLNTKNNTLNLLQSDLSVENFDATVLLRNDKISVNGRGDIRDIDFDINLNPAADKNILLDIVLFNRLNNLKIRINQFANKSWKSEIKSPIISADAFIFPQQGLPAMVELKNLKITSLDEIKGKLQIMPKDIPSIHLSGENIVIDDYQLPDFSVNLTQKEQTLLINNLTFKNLAISEKNLSFNGDWQHGKTNLSAKASGKTLSDFLTKLNIKEHVSGGEFDFNIDLFCLCAPWNMSFPNLAGLINISVAQGVFTDKDPNIGRILSLLNIRSIAQRLRLDISDITSKGFAYNNIKARLRIENSLINIDDFKLNATSSQIKLTGSSHLLKKTYNLRAKVRPAIADSVPIATYLAGGGLAGLGIWLVDKTLFKGELVNKIVSEITEFNYKITGPWEQPIIQ